jgi:hypothetical protein
MHQTKHHVKAAATLASYSEGPRFDPDRKVLSGISQFLAANIFIAPWNGKRAYFEIIYNKLCVVITQFDAI